MSTNNILQTMRLMAWERAKGELLSILQTFWEEESSFDSIDKKVKDFIQDVEDNEVWM